MNFLPRVRNIKISKMTQDQPHATHSIMPWDERTRKPPPLCPFSARKTVQVQPMQVSPGMPASCPCPGTPPRHPSPCYERTGTFQRPTAPSPHVHLRSQNAMVETGDTVPRSPIRCCFCVSQNTCHPCQMLERPGLLSEPRCNHGDTLSTKATQRCASQSPVRVSPQQVNANTGPWATPVVTHKQGCSMCLRKATGLHTQVFNKDPSQPLTARSV